MGKPIVTALVDTYNHEPYIEQALLSVLDQGLSPSELEIVVVDDGSADNTPSIIRRFTPRVRYLHKEHGGQASAFNVVIPEARGEIVAFLDGDDWWAGNKLRQVLDAFEKNPDVGTVGHGYYETCSDPSLLESVVPERTCQVQLRDPAGARLFNALRIFFGTSRLSLRKAILGRVPTIPKELTFSADAFLYTLAVGFAGAIVLEQPLTYYRVHAHNLVATTEPAKMRRRQEMQALVLEKLIPHLSILGMPGEATQVLIEPDLVDAERLKLGRSGFKRWQTFRVERAAYRLAYKDVGLGYLLFKWLVLGLTLMIPPQRFYQLKQWYADNNIRRIRSVLGEPPSAATVLVRRHRIAVER
jgi:glycosyltransferase involved in cell wall biosynthesis